LFYFVLKTQSVSQSALSPIQAPARTKTRFRHGLLGKAAFAFLWLLVFSIPWESALMVPSLGTIARLIGTLAGGFGVLAIFERQSIRLPGPGHVLMALFVLWAAASYLWSADPERTAVAATSYLQLLMMVLLIWEFSSREAEQRRLLQAYVLGTFVSGVDTVYQFLSHIESAYQRYAGTALNADDLGLIMALSIPASYYLLIQSKGWTAWVYRVQLVLAGTCILLSAAKGSFLAALLALSIVPLTYAYVRLTWRQRIAIFPTVALLVCGGLFFVPATSWKRISTIPNELAGGTLTGRTFVWAAGWEVFRAHPFLGVGAAAFGQSATRTLPIPSQELKEFSVVAHNTFLSVLVEEGVTGFGLFCGLLCVLVLSTKEMPSLPQKLWIVSLGVWVVGVSSLTWELRKPTWFFFGLLLAQGASMAQKRSRPALADNQPPLLRASES
jgi:O-antigen ligase